MKRIPFPRIAAPLCAAALVIIEPLSALADVTFKVVAQVGQPAPAGGAFLGPNVNGRFVPVLNADGKVAFTGLADLGSLDVIGGIWHGPPGGLARFVATGEPAPGASGTTFVALDPGQCCTQQGLVLLSRSAIVFAARLAGDLVTAPDNDYGIWGGPPGGLRLLARRGDPAPGSDGTFGRGFSFFPALNAVDQVAFNADLGPFNRPGLDDDRLYFGAVNNVSSVLADGNPAPRGGPLINFANPRFQRVFLNDVGQVLLQADLAAGDPPVQSTTFVTGNPGSLREVARLGDALPGGGTLVAEGGAGSLGEVDFNNAGQVVLTAFASQDLKQSGVWLWDGSLTTLARTGDRAPGTPEGVVFDEFKEAAINATGQVVFRAKLTGPGVTAVNNAGLWMGTPGTLRPVALEGQPAPGTTNQFRDFDAGDTARPFYRINSGGQIAFRAAIGTASFTSAKGIWLYDGTGSVTLVVVTRTELPDARGVSRLFFDLETVGERLATANARAEVGGGQDGKPNWFNDAGQIAFSVSFGGTGMDAIYVASTQSAPLEPPRLEFEPLLAGGAFRVTLPSVAGVTYTLEANASLGPSEWTGVASLPGTGAALTLEDPAPSGLVRFYRVRLDRL
ncbi:MAG: hypothetical protein HYY24_19460 [Verrucomicrobia bacterium]|nr:hypothetical protein [Verrucomicrobiota bacterium]